MAAPADILHDVAVLEAELGALVWAAEQRRGPGDGTGYESVALLDLLSQAALLGTRRHVHATLLRPFGAAELDGHLGEDGTLISAQLFVHGLERTYYRPIHVGTGLWRALEHLARAQTQLEAKHARFASPGPLPKMG